MANTRRMNRLEELGRVDAEKAYTRKGNSTKRSMGPAEASTVSADGKRMAQRKKARDAMAQLTRLLGSVKKRRPSAGMVGDLRSMMKRKVPKPLTGRSAAAKKAAGKSKKVATMIGKFKQGKGNPAGKDMSLRGRLMKSVAKMKNYKAKPLRGGGVAKRGMGRAK